MSGLSTKDSEYPVICKNSSEPKIILTRVIVSNIFFWRAILAYYIMTYGNFDNFLGVSVNAGAKVRHF